jgi:hypothetical protein
MNLVTLEKEIKEFSAEEFVGFKNWFAQLEHEVNLQSVQMATTALQEFLKLPPEQRGQHLRKASKIAQTENLYAPNSEIMEWENVGIDDGIEDE